LSKLLNSNKLHILSSFLNAIARIKISKEHDAHFCLEFKNKLRTIAASGEERSLKFSIKQIFVIMYSIVIK